jgi:hypothetical protein
MARRPASPGSAQHIEILPEHLGIVVTIVPGGVEEGNGFAPGSPGEGPEGAPPGLEFAKVGAAELPPSVRVVVEPAAELVGGGNFLEPLVKPGIALGYAPGPELIHKNPVTIVASGLVVDSFQGNRHDSPPVIDEWEIHGIL